METLLLERPEVPDGPYVVAGIRRAGQAAVDALCRLAGSEQVSVFDHSIAGTPKRVRRALAAAGVRAYLGHDGQVPDLELVKTLVKSPGISFDAPLVQLARRRGVTVLDELELGWRMSRTPMIAVTGTRGKTTVAGLTGALLAASGRAVALAGNTDLGPPLSAVGDGLDWIVCEVSSFQLEGCPDLLPEVAVFTNLTHDHLARHRTMRRYGQLKRRLFVRRGAAAPLAVIDTSDEFGKNIACEVQALGGQVVRVGTDADADYRIRSARWDLRCAEIQLQTPTGALNLQTRLPGRHNARNAAAVVALGDLFDVDRDLLAGTLASHEGLPGRFEHLDLGQKYKLILDAAPSPAAVEQFLGAVRTAMNPSGRLWVVLGVVGSPGRAQRRAMGRVARSLCDQLILTAGSFRADQPSQVLQDMAAGAGHAHGADVEVVPRRRDAIVRALRAARPPDVVTILGRGWLMETVSARHLDDKQVMLELL